MSRSERTTQSAWTPDAENLLNELTRIQADELAERAENIAALHGRSAVSTADVMEARDTLHGAPHRRLVANWRNLSLTYRTTLLTSAIATVSVGSIVIALAFYRDSLAELLPLLAATFAAVTALAASLLSAAKARRAAVQSEALANEFFSQMREVDIRARFIAEWARFENALRQKVDAQSTEPGNFVPLRRMLDRFADEFKLDAASRDEIRRLLNLRNIIVHGADSNLSLEDFADASASLRKFTDRLGGF